MVGYGKEDDHFVVELTYNYGIKNYVKGNEFQVLSPTSLTAWLDVVLSCRGSVCTRRRLWKEQRESTMLKELYCISHYSKHACEPLLSQHRGRMEL